jgi:hypothetical protein
MVDKNDEALRNCGFCKKPVKRAKRFYRNNKYYCNENCWQKTKQEAKSKGTEAVAT